MLDLRRRMGMDPWHRREKSAGKPDIQVIFSGPVSMSSVMSKLQRKTAQFTKKSQFNVYFCPRILNFKTPYIYIVKSSISSPFTSFLRE